MLFHGLLSVIAIGGVVSSVDPLRSQSLDIPALTLPRPETYAAKWRSGHELWIQNGRWTFAQPELGLATQCSVSMEISEHDRIRLLENKRSILHFRFPGGRVRLIPQMVSGDLGNEGLLFWTQQFGGTMVSPARVHEASFAVAMENPARGGWEKGVPLLTVEASGFESLGGTRLTHMWCQGEFMKLEKLQRVFETPGKIITDN